MKRLVSISRVSRIALTFLAITSASLTSRAQPAGGPAVGGRDEGRTRFLRGIELYKEGNYHAALAEFRAAYAAAPSSRIQYNVGQTLFQLQDYSGALTAFEAYESEGRDKLPEDRLHEVDADIAKLRQRVATLRLVVIGTPGATPNGIVVTIDDEARATTSAPGADARTVRVSEGRRKVAITASGFSTETRVLDVAGSSVIELRFELKPIAPVAAASAPGPASDLTYPSDEGSSKSRVPLYLALGGTVALGATAITFTVLAGNKHAKYNDATNEPNPDPQNLSQLRSSTKTLALAADIFGGVAVLAGVTSVVLLLTTGHDDRKPPATGLVVEPRLGLGSLGISGTF